MLLLLDSKIIYIKLTKFFTFILDTIKEPSKYCSDKHLSAKECEENNM